MSEQCYLGHEDCFDRHEAERLADEADWEEDREEMEIAWIEHAIGFGRSEKTS